MADKPQVVKLAQPGIDVKTAGDDKLVYNSNWPLLKIYKQGEFATSDLGSLNQLVINHNLGYIPLYWFFANTTTSSYLNSFSNAIDDKRSEFFGPLNNFPEVTKTSLIYQGSNDTIPRGAIKFYYYIFALDVTKAFTAPNIKSGGVIGPRNTKTVFKLAKEGKDISSHNLEDYVIHSQARSPLIHAVVPFTTATDSSLFGYGFTYYHNLGYVPLFFAMVRLPGTVYEPVGNQMDAWELLPINDPSASGFTVDESKISFSGDNNMNMSLVILKDPFDINNITPVNV